MMVWRGGREQKWLVGAQISVPSAALEKQQILAAMVLIEYAR